uniref:C2 domain first repeat protein n=1 Tax=Rhizophora mucronata TaxID=61149 RepID=A0A2P2QKY2_RHIMU
MQPRTERRPRDFESLRCDRLLRAKKADAHGHTELGPDVERSAGVQRRQAI